MPRKGRGGSRIGRSGEVYTNRTDLNQPVRTTGEREPVYGTKKRQAEVIQAGQMGQTPPIGPAPGELPSLFDETARPDEPVTAGLPIGPGAGPDSLTPVPVVDDALYELRALAEQFPEYRDLQRLILRVERER